MSKRVESTLRVLGYLILLLAFLTLAVSTHAQYEVNREARLQKWTLISMELSDINSASSDWNSAVKRYKTLDDIQTWELLNAVRKSQAANAKIEQYLMTLDESLGTLEVAMPMKEFRCTCGTMVFTNDQKRTKCTSCEDRAKSSPPPQSEDYPLDRFGDH